jgi:hypothetical protein
VALDALTGKQSESRRSSIRLETTRIVCCGLPTSAAVLEASCSAHARRERDRADAKTGKELWRTKSADPGATAIP